MNSFYSFTKHDRFFLLTIYINGALHWLICSVTYSIAYFDFDNDEFGFHSLPHDVSGTTIGVLEEDCLCICDFSCVILIYG